MIDLSNETVIPLAKAAKHIPGRPHVATLYRWAGREQNGLETVRIGGRIFTSVQAIERFAVRCTNPSNQAVRTPARRKREVVAAEALLERAKIV